MKIIKESVEKLVEAEETKVESGKTLADIDPKTASEEKVADAVKNSVEAATDGEATLSEPKAEKIAAEVKEVAKELDTDKAVIIPDAKDTDEYISKNIITNSLDACKAAAERNMRRGHNANANLLLIGLPGSAKTANVKQWASENGLILVPLNATDPKIETMINGMPMRDQSAAKDSPNKIIWAYAEDKLGALMDPKNAGKCVLFVDEFNRQQNLGLRRAFLSLFNEKTNADGKLDFTKTLLFTVVCINPAVPSDKGASNLIQAEMDRFYKKKDIYSTTEAAMDFFTKWKAKELLKYGIALEGSKLAKKFGKWGPFRELTPEENEDVNGILREADLALSILSNPNFSFDGEDLIGESDELYSEKMINLLDTLHRKHLDLLSQRNLTEMILNSDGDPKQVLAMLDSKDKRFLPDTEQMLRDCLNSYIQDLPSLRKEVGLDGGNTATPKDTEEKPEDNKKEKEEPQEDNDELFTKQAGGKVAKSESSVAQELNSFKLNF